MKGINMTDLDKWELKKIEGLIKLFKINVEDIYLIDRGFFMCTIDNQVASLKLNKHDSGIILDFQNSDVVQNYTISQFKEGPYIKFQENHVNKKFGINNDDKLLKSFVCNCILGENNSHYEIKKYSCEGRIGCFELDADEKFEFSREEQLAAFKVLDALTESKDIPGAFGYIASRINKDKAKHVLNMSLKSTDCKWKNEIKSIGGEIQYYQSDDGEYDKINNEIRPISEEKGYFDLKTATYIVPEETQKHANILLLDVKVTEKMLQDFGFTLPQKTKIESISEDPSTIIENSENYSGAAKAGNNTNSQTQGKIINWGKFMYD